MGILVFLKGIIPHIIELKQSKCRLGYGELLLWPARKPKGVGARGMGKVAFSDALWLPLPRKRGILSEENVSPVTGSGLDAQIQVWGVLQIGVRVICGSKDFGQRERSYSDVLQLLLSLVDVR